MNEQLHQQQVNTSRAQWYAHIETWEQSGKSQACFVVSLTYRSRLLVIGVRNICKNSAPTSYPSSL